MSVSPPPSPPSIRASRRRRRERARVRGGPRSAAAAAGANARGSAVVPDPPPPPIPARRPNAATAATAARGPAAADGRRSAADGLEARPAASCTGVNGVCKFARRSPPWNSDWPLRRRKCTHTGRQSRPHIRLGVRRTLFLWPHHWAASHTEITRINLPGFGISRNRSFCSVLLSMSYFKPGNHKIVFLSIKQSKNPEAARHVKKDSSTWHPSALHHECSAQDFSPRPPYARYLR